MSFLRKRRVQLPNGRTVDAGPPSLRCDRCGATFPCSRPFALDGAGCIRCDHGRVHPTEHLEDLLRVEAEAGVNQLQAWLRGVGL